MLMASLGATWLPVIIGYCRLSRGNRNASVFSKLAGLFGVGLMLATALAIILPEGAEQLYLVYGQKLLSDDEHEHTNATMTADEPWIVTNTKPSAVLGLSIVFGFIFMMLIDECNRHEHHPIEDLSRQSDHVLISLSEPRKSLTTHANRSESSIRRRETQSSQDYGTEELMPLNESIISPKSDTSNHLPILNVTLPETSRHHHGHHSGAVTLGLLVHAASDGLALAAASLAEHAKVQVSVTLALLLHKAPASLGLSLYLQSKKTPLRLFIWHTTLFAIAAPMTALVFIDVGSQST